MTKRVDELTKGLAEVRKEVLDNNTKLINAVKKTLPKVKEAAVAELKEKIQPLEDSLSLLKGGIETERKNITSKAQGASAEASKDVHGLLTKIRELEDAVAGQKSALLDIGAKLHELEGR